MFLSLLLSSLIQAHGSAVRTQAVYKYSYFPSISGIIERWVQTPNSFWIQIYFIDVNYYRVLTGTTETDRTENVIKAEKRKDNRPIKPWRNMQLHYQIVSEHSNWFKYGRAVYKHIVKKPFTADY